MGSGSMNHVHDLPPRHHLFFIPNSRCVRPFRSDTPNTSNFLISNPRKRTGSGHSPLTRHKDTFCDYEPSTACSALAVILLHHIGRNRSDGAVSGERGHEDSIVDRDGAELEWPEEDFGGCHRHFLTRALGVLLAYKGFKDRSGVIPCETGWMSFKYTS